MAMDCTNAKVFWGCYKTHNGIREKKDGSYEKCDEYHDFEEIVYPKIRYPGLPESECLTQWIRDNGIAKSSYVYSRELTSHEMQHEALKQGRNMVDEMLEPVYSVLLAIWRFFNKEG